MECSVKVRKATRQAPLRRTHSKQGVVMEALPLLIFILCGRALEEVGDRVVLLRLLLRVRGVGAEVSRLVHALEVIVRWLLRFLGGGCGLGGFGKV